MSKFWHGVAQVGLATIGVAATVGWLAPPPFNIILVGGTTLTQAILALKHHGPAPIAGTGPPAS